MTRNRKGLIIPLYPLGGEFGNIVKNTGLAYADTLLSTAGATNVIKDSNYSGNSAEGFAKAGNIAGGITKMAAPIVANSIAPGSGAAVSAGQNLVGSTMNPQDPNSQGVNPNQMMNMAKTGMQIYNMGNQMGAFRNGGMQYANGGVNAEVEKQENSVAPDGEFTQYNGPSHAQGGIKTFLEGGEKVFSDRLKMGNKTFADLNKPNNTKKEDKILENTNSTSIARLTAELMKSTKVKNSERLFAEQEALKESQYKSQLEKDMFACGGLMKYRDGGIHIKPSNVGKFTSAAKRAGMSVEEYANYIAANKENFTSQVSQYSKGGVQKYPDGGMTPQQWNDQYKAKGWAVDPRQNTATGRGKYPAYYDPNTVKIAADPHQEIGYSVTGLLPDNSNYAAYTAPTNKASIDTQVPPQYIPAEQTTYMGKPAGSFKSTTDTDPNNRYVFAGGQYIKMANGGNFVEDPNYVRAGRGTDTMGDDRMDAFSNTAMPVTQGEAGVPWGNIAKQIGMGVAQNAGNIYDLSRANKVETTKFDRMTPSLLDPTAALNYNMVMGRKLNEDIRNSSGGNASNYIQNRKDAAVNQMMSNSQIRQNYANQNAGINNQAGMFNTGIANQEITANEQNRAASRNIKGNAYSNIGQNIMGQYKDSKLENRDEDMLNIIEQQYPEARYNPALKNYYKQRRTSISV